MKVQASYKIRTSILLAIYIAILGASAMHVHEHVHNDVVCQDCSSHAKHQGHIVEGTDIDFDCVLCKFFHNTYLTPQATRVASATLAGLERANAVQPNVDDKDVRLPLLRAPPAC